MSPKNMSPKNMSPKNMRQQKARTDSAQVRARSARGLKHRGAPFALDGQDRRHRAGIRRLCRFRGRNVGFGLRAPAHEYVVDQPLGAMARSAEREPARDRRQRIEGLIG